MRKAECQLPYIEMVSVWEHLDLLICLEWDQTRPGAQRQWGCRDLELRSRLVYLSLPPRPLVCIVDVCLQCPGNPEWLAVGGERGEKGTDATEKAFSPRGIVCLETPGRAGFVPGRSSLRVQGPTYLVYKAYSLSSGSSTYWGSVGKLLLWK